MSCYFAVSTGNNQASALLKVVITIVSIVATLFSFIAFIPASVGPKANKNERADLAVAVVLGTMVMLPIVLFAVAAYLQRDFLASRSDECWPPTAADSGETGDLW